MNGNQLDHNDPDLQLAREVGQLLEEGKNLEGLDDPIVGPLLAYKKSRRFDFKGAADMKRQAWEAIHSQTGAGTPSESKAPVTRLFASSAVRWAAAAALLIAAVLSFAYYQFYTQPQLLAGSGPQRETVTLRDGSTVQLRPHSKLYALERTPEIMRYRLQGEGYFEVVSNSGRSFSVLTETGRVSVLGTSFTLSSWGAQMQVYLREGSVSVQGLDSDSTVILSPGQSASVSGSNGVPRLDTGQAREFTDWLDGQLIFEDKPAGYVVQELEQQFNLSIQLPASTAEDTLSGRLSLEELRTALGDLELVLDGKFVETGDRSYRFEANQP